MSHTEGKWKVDKAVMCIVSEDEGGLTTLICDVQTKGIYESEAEKNAQLISAAPDLYKICNGILCCPHTKDGEHTTKYILTDAHIKMLKDATAKAILSGASQSS